MLFSFNNKFDQQKFRCLCEMNMIFLRIILDSSYPSFDNDFLEVLGDKEVDLYNLSVF